VAGLESNENRVGRARRVRLARFLPEIANRHRAHDVGPVDVRQLRRRPQLDAAVRQVAPVDEDRGARIATQVAHLDVVRRADDIEAAVAPLVPDGREQHASVSAVGGQHGDDRKRQEVGELGQREVAAHVG
jgi:hypothetical protein